MPEPKKKPFKRTPPKGQNDFTKTAVGKLKRPSGTTAMTVLHLPKDEDKKKKKK